MEKPEKRCKLGRCEKTGRIYQGATEEVRNKLRNGICPICGGPTERKYEPDLKAR